MIIISDSVWTRNSYTTISLFTLFSSTSHHSQSILLIVSVSPQKSNSVRGVWNWHRFILQTRLWAHEMSKGTGGLEAHAPSDREFADSQKGGGTSDVIPFAVQQKCHTVLPRRSVVRLAVIPVLVGHPPSCQIHKVAFSLLICDAQEGLFSD